MNSLGEVTNTYGAGDSGFQSVTGYDDAQLDFLEVFRLPGKGRWTRAIALYDALPKFVYGADASARLSDFADSIRERKIVIRGTEYSVSVAAAAVKGTKGEKGYGRWPGEREELIMRALRYTVVQKRVPMSFWETEQNLDSSHPQLRVTFTLSELETLLKEWGHTFSLRAIDEGLTVLVRSTFSVVSIGGDVSREQGHIAEYSRAKASGTHGTRLCRVTLNSLETDAILSGAYRLLNWQKLMALQSPLARRIFEIVLTTFLDAEAPEDVDDYGPHKVFRLTLSGLLAEGVIEKAKQRHKTLARVRSALSELQAQKILVSLDFAKDELPKSRKEGRGRPRIVDVVWLLRLRKEAVSEVIQANAEARPFASDRVVQSLPLELRTAQRRREIEKLN